MNSESTPRQVSLARIAEFGIVPRRSLGQNFLVDDNIIRVILDRLDPQPDDVAIEVGAGLGVLTRALAGALRFVHAFEIDRGLAGALEATLAEARSAGMVSVAYADIMKVPLETLEPRPTLCASNLPYSVAAPFIGEALERLPEIRRFCVMTQREVAERMAAPPGGKEYGGLSVWVQTHTRVVELRPLSRSIFHPKPNVDSSLVTLERAPSDPLVTEHPAALRRVIEGAFAQRRKLAVNSLAATLGVGKDEVTSAFTRAGLPGGARAEQIPPNGFIDLTAVLMDDGIGDLAKGPCGEEERADDRE